MIICRIYGFFCCPQVAGKKKLYHFLNHKCETANLEELTGSGAGGNRLLPYHCYLGVPHQVGLYSSSKYHQFNNHLHVGSSCCTKHQQRMCEGLIFQHILLTAVGVPALFSCSLTPTNHLTKLFFETWQPLDSELSCREWLCEQSSKSNKMQLNNTRIRKCLSHLF